MIRLLMCMAHRRVRRAGAAMMLLCLLQALPAGAQPVFDAAHVGQPGSGNHAELFMPAAAAPVPALVVLHGCDGVGPHYRGWAKALQGWGYAALVIDSFRTRGQVNVCNHGRDVPPQDRAQDALRAAAYLRSLPAVRADRIGVIGFSHGGWSALYAALEDALPASRSRAFDAAVAFYPACDQPTARLVTDTLILIGDADDWTPWRRCQRWRDTVQSDVHSARIKVYPGARHGFDSTMDLHRYAGHLVGRNGAAAQDAEILTRAFLAERLSAR
ncbi:dienelactone hydrolase family protein [Vineibacter terrae]|uniref:dienelactone hydrolase family protein n=1 Tax=Vineibacter terrae TaxID=2586908 RepID=UPI002E2EEF65|nr:dienelactone hydrolase family protein [Vineibacter terrae]HEX2889194.1 dienelactone hydrolase family protein [Vineibacter terrae]